MSITVNIILGSVHQNLPTVHFHRPFSNSTSLPSTTTMHDPSTSQIPPKPPSIPPRGSHHRRSHSEANYRLPDSLDLVSSDAPASSFDEIGSEDDVFSTYMNMDKFDVGRGGGGNGDDEARVLKHRYSHSIDGSHMVDFIDAKKAMAPDQLAELWTVDPKRAKRILANRQSAARSKERKARYMLELERKVQTLQTEATTLSAQLALFQRDTMELTNENSELKNRLQTLEQQARLRDAVNESLPKEVDRLKKATGEKSSPSDNYSLGMPNILYNHSSFTTPQHHASTNETQNIHMSQFRQLQSSMVAHHVANAAKNSHGFSAMSQQDSLSRLQGLDINGRGPVIVKSEGPSLSASESSC